VRILIVSGIWPPDVGGPASHAPELAEFLRARGHDVAVITAADRAPAAEAYPVRFVSRRLPVGVRHVQGALLIAAGARRADVVYSTGMVGRSATGTTIARRPLVVKLTGDPAFERALRRGVTSEPLDRFQQERGRRIAFLRGLRDLSLRRAARIVCPSAVLREFAAAWGIPRERIEVLPNPVPEPPAGDREELRRRHGLEGATLVFAGRFVPQKSLEVALEALRRNEGVALVLAGDGPERARIEAAAARLGLDGRARFLGAQPRRVVFELLRAADAALLSSSWENFPHVVVEALAVGTPVLATDAGGVAEILEDGRNGLLVPPHDPEALAGAIRRYFADGELRARLREGAVASAGDYAPERIYERLETILLEVAR
jgi:glycosyltransferase involved in cell wall biosynthesis